jgi:glycosyltransferase involved in cell wall biosynthesis
MPQFSVIVPNYNHASYLKQRIESILNQSFQDFELILLDDCSIDNSREVLQIYRNHSKVTHCVFNEKNSGNTFQQWDKGIQLSQGEFIWIAESDDVAEPEFLSEIYKATQQFPESGLLYTGFRMIDNKNEIIYCHNTGLQKEMVKYQGIDFIKKKIIVSNSICNASMMVFKRSLYESIDMNQIFKMRYCGDWFFYTLLSEITSVIEIKKVLNNFRVHSQNVSTGAEKLGKPFTEGLEIYDYQKRYLNSIELIRFNFNWGKSLYRSIKKYEISLEIQQQIFESVNVNNRGIYFWYLIYQWLKR